ncbi:MAG TPA: hypothetical protein VFR52_03860 [Sphingomicrobium sp.]|nr:hypothetical protein [Sphingomicrobium sp.]
MPEGMAGAATVGKAIRGLSWRQEIALFLLTTLLLTWPMWINGAPFYTGDSASYLRGGNFGFHTGLQMLHQWWNTLAGASPVTSTSEDPKAVVAAAVAESGGVRSVIYSVTTYLFRWPGQSLIALGIFQASAVALAVGLMRSKLAPRADFQSSLVAAGAISLLTTAPWYAAYAMPDIFAGVAIAGAIVLTLFFGRIGPAARILLVLLIAFCITVHGTHLPVALVVLLAGAIASFLIQPPRRGDAATRALWFASPLVLAVVALLGTSYLAFGEPSLAPKRYPIQLARSVADGPGAWHLRDHCATERYAICEIFGPNPPRKSGDFLWSRDGVRYRATPEQMERIRAEESLIVWRAAMEYPVEQFRLSARNIARQLTMFGPDDLEFGQRLVGRTDPTLTQISATRPRLTAFAETVVYLSFFLSALLLIAVRRQVRPVEKGTIAIVVIGLLANAAICGILSGVTDRYQGRVAWLLPAAAIFILLRIRSQPGPAATASVT